MFFAGRTSKRDVTRRENRIWPINHFCQRHIYTIVCTIVVFVTSIFAVCEDTANLPVGSLRIFFPCTCRSAINRRYSLMTVPRTEVFSSLAPECVTLAWSASSISKANRVSSASEIRFYSLNKRHSFHSRLVRF